MDKREVMRQIQERLWDEVSETILDCDDNEIFKLALQQESCPEDIILDLWQALDPEVRLLVAKHPNTPMHVLKEMIQSDKDPEIRKYASKSYHERRRGE